MRPSDRIVVQQRNDGDHIAVRWTWFQGRLGIVNGRLVRFPLNEAGHIEADRLERTPLTSPSLPRL